MENLLVSEEMQKKVTRSHQRQLAELTIVTRVVPNNDVAVSSNSALKLQQVLEVSHVIMGKSCAKLMCVARKYSNALAKISDKIVALCPGRITLDVVDIGKCKIRSTCLIEALLRKFIYRPSLHGILPFVGNVQKDISIN